MSTGLVPRDGGLPSIDAAKAKLAELTEDGNVEALGEVAAQAEAYRHYEQRQGFKERADHFVRLRLLAEAGIGAVDLAANPRTQGTQLTLAGENVRGRTRRAWRSFAIARLQGRFDAAVDALADDPVSELSSTALDEHLRRQGTGWIQNKPLRRKFEKLATDGLTMRTLAERAGVSYPSVVAVLGRNRSRSQWGTAAPIAEALGFDLAQLPPAPVPAHLRRRRRRKLRPVASLTTGGRWDEAYVRLRKALDEFGKLAGEGLRWDESYAHFYALEATISNQLKREDT